MQTQICKYGVPKVTLPNAREVPSFTLDTLRSSHMYTPSMASTLRSTDQGNLAEFQPMYPTLLFSSASPFFFLFPAPATQCGFQFLSFPASVLQGLPWLCFFFHVSRTAGIYNHAGGGAQAAAKPNTMTAVTVKRMHYGAPATATYH